MKYTACGQSHSIITDSVIIMTRLPQKLTHNVPDSNSIYCTSAVPNLCDSEQPILKARVIIYTDENFHIAFPVTFYYVVYM